jgi:flagellar hook-basal body complex protein FliE
VVSTPIQSYQPVLRAFERVEEGIPLKADSGSFADLLRRAINDAGDLQSDAKGMIEAFLRGDPVDLHQVMAAVEEAGISLDLLVEVRNKLTEAYRSVMQM